MKCTQKYRTGKKFNIDIDITDSLHRWRIPLLVTYMNVRLLNFRLSVFCVGIERGGLKPFPRNYCAPCKKNKKLWMLHILRKNELKEKIRLTCSIPFFLSHWWIQVHTNRTNCIDEYRDFEKKDIFSKKKIFPIRHRTGNPRN